MLLVAITNWRRKLGLIFRLILFLVLIGFIIPRFLNFITAEIADYKSQTEGGTPPALRVEKETPEANQAPGQVQDESFLEKLHQFYYGQEPNLEQ